jgi:High potential iron-sulfur protein
MREVLVPQRINRRRVLISLISSAPLTALSFGGAKAVEKVPQKAAQYQPAPKGGQACAGCNSYIAPNNCKLVAGEISPSGWCRLWTKKEG